MSVHPKFLECCQQIHQPQPTHPPRAAYRNGGNLLHGPEPKARELAAQHASDIKFWLNISMKFMSNTTRSSNHKVLLRKTNKDPTYQLKCTVSGPPHATRYHISGRGYGNHTRKHLCPSIL